MNQETDNTDSEYSKFDVWNHRVVSLASQNGGEPWLEFREVWYDSKGNITGQTDICLGSETPEGLRWILQQLMKALDQPVVQE